MGTKAVARILLQQTNPFLPIRRWQPLLLCWNPLLLRSIRNRFPYLDPLNHIQVIALRRTRSTDGADPYEQSRWLAALDNAEISARRAVARSVTTSPAYTTRLIDLIYNNFLGRDPSATELSQSARSKISR